MKDRVKAVLAVYLVLLKDNREVLLLLRENTGYCDGLYSLVAGHIEEHETIMEGMIREAQEEAGVTLNKKDLSVACVIHRKTHDREVMDFFIKAQQWQGNIVNMEPHKCGELKFFALNKLPANVIDYVRVGLECVKNNIFYAEYGW